MNRLNLQHAQALVESVLKAAGDLQLKPLCVVAVDAGGDLLALARQDNASSLRVRVAWAKASGALALGMSSRKLAAIAADRPSFFASIASLAPEGLVAAAGGIILVNENDEAIGALGVSGDTSDNDEVVALTAIAATGLRSQG